MTRLLILMGALAAMLSACGPPDPGMMAQEEFEADMANPRGDMDDADMPEVPAGF